MTASNKVIETLLESEVLLIGEIQELEAQIKDLKDKRRGIARTLKSFGYVKPETTEQPEPVVTQPESE